MNRPRTSQGLLTLLLVAVLVLAGACSSGSGTATGSGATSTDSGGSGPASSDSGSSSGDDVAHFCAVYEKAKAQTNGQSGSDLPSVKKESKVTLAQLEKVEAVAPSDIAGAVHKVVAAYRKVDKLIEATTSTADLEKISKAVDAASRSVQSSSDRVKAYAEKHCGTSDTDTSGTDTAADTDSGPSAIHTSAAAPSVTTTAPPTTIPPTTVAPTAPPTSAPPVSNPPQAADPAHCTSGPHCENGWNLDDCQGYLGAVQSAGRPPSSGEIMYLHDQCGIDLP